MSSRSKWRAFTLIEVLVVVAIIALLISILMPSLAAAREESQIVVCKTRLREIYNGHLFYAHDARNRFPHWDWWLWDGKPDHNEAQAKFYASMYASAGGQRPTDSSRWVEYGQIYRYIRVRETYFCPKDSKRRIGVGIGVGGERGDKPIHSYSRFLDPHDWLSERMGSNKSADEGTVTQADFINPDQIRPGAIVPPAKDVPPFGPYTTTPERLGLMMEEYPGYDDKGSLPKSSQGTDDRILNDGYVGFMRWQEFLALRHNGKGHILYFDGHTQLADAKQFNLYPSSFYAARMAVGARQR